MDIRKTLDLLESKDDKKLERVKLHYSKSALNPVMSSTLLELHYDKLYKGYVDRFNRGEGDPQFNEAGAYLHGLFFSQFKTPQSQAPRGAILSLIERQHKSFVDFKKVFKEIALKMQGSGWVYLSRSGQIKTIHNHTKRSDIVLIIDMWEHAYQNDYGSNKSKYIDNFWRIIDWAAINHRI
jgi:Fe-Mn family superoxide dismutase